MKAGWQLKKLGELCQIRTGKKDVNQGNPEGVYPFFTCAAQHTFSDSYSFDTEALLIAGNGNVGQVSYYQGKFEAYQRTYVLSDFSQVEPRYLFLMLDGKLKETVSKQKLGNTMPYIKVGMLKDFLVPIPPLPEQHRIVAILDEAFDGIATAKANAEKNLQNARALFESHLQSVFTERGEGWGEMPIGKVCQRLHQGLNTAGEKIKFVETGYPIIQTRNIDEGVVDLDHKMKFMSEDDWRLYKDKYRPEIGDVFFTNIGTIGKTAIVTEECDYLIHWNIFKLRPHFDLIGPAYLRYALEQLTLSGYFKRMQKGGTVDFVTKKMISEATLPLPSVATQAEIVCQLDAVREETQNLEALYLRKLDALDQLKKSLLHQAFSGLL